ncbi:MAG: hypothetical protein DMF84_09185 [Acidobacteria bacterium]|nr:MAG: hypothetical protein DMF84_09185 [Acidobacteriota bacterium]
MAVAWIVVALGGGLAISMLRNANVIRLLIPCVLLLTYFWYALSESSRNAEKIGDSVYFLGFLWTLYALADALIVSRGREVGVEDVFAIFGYALITTGLGMFLRMLILQFRYAVPDQLEDGREELARQLQAFRDEIAFACEGVNTFRNKALASSEMWLREWEHQSQRMQETIGGATLGAVQHVRKATEEVAREVLGAADGAHQASQAMMAVARTTTSLARRLDANQQKWATSLENGVTETTKALEEWVERVRRIEVPSEAFSKRIDEAVTPLRESAARLAQTFAETSAKTQQLERHVSDAAPAVENFKGSVSKASTHLQEFGQSMSRSREAAQSFWGWWKSR